MENEEEQKREFTGVWIPRHIIEDNSLSWTDRGLYGEIASYKQCFKGNKALAERVGLKERQVRNIISLLKSKGYVEQAGFDGRKRYLVALKDAPSNVRQTGNKLPPREEVICHPDRQQIATIDNNRENTLEKNGTEVPLAQTPKANNEIQKSSVYGKQNPEINEAFSSWEKAMGYAISANLARNRNAAYSLIRKHSLAGLTRVINGLPLVHSLQYAPAKAKPSDFIELQQNWDKVMAQGYALKGGQNAPARF